MSRKFDVLERQLAVGQEAAIALEATAKLDAERENQIINDLVNFFRCEPWDERTAIRYVACLSELRARREELQHRARKAAEAREKLTTASDDAAEE